jgi:hypothetical protein
MEIPGFNAQFSLGKPTRTYRGQYLIGRLAQRQSGMPASIVPAQLEGMEGEEINGEDFEVEDIEIEVEDGEIEEGEEI